ncbi:MAG: AMP-binding protein [Desulfatiglans sp.]|nr:AMP-binding protein [Desulfatiglans sp.]
MNLLYSDLYSGANPIIIVSIFLSGRKKQVLKLKFHCKGHMNEEDFVELRDKPEINGVREIETYLAARFELMCEEHPDNTAIIFLDTKFSYAKLQDLIKRFATALSDLGVGRGDKVVIYMWNCPQWIICYFGIQAIGAVAVPVSPIYTYSELKHIVDNSGAETIICHDTNIGYVRRIMSDTSLKRIITSNIADSLPWWKQWFGRAFDRIPTGKVVRDNHVYSLVKLLRKYPPEPPLLEIRRGGELAAILYTGGTTGPPKGVPCTHSYLLDVVITTREMWRDFIEGNDNRFLLVNPLFHILGQLMPVVLSFHLGNTLVLMPRANIDAILEAIQRYRITLFLGVPALYRMILEHDRLDLYDLSTLRQCMCGGDRLPSEVYYRWRDKTQVLMRQTYGSTEGNMISVSPMDKELPADSVGLLLPGRHAKFVDPDTLEPVPTGQSGELLISTKYMAKDYWNRPEETAYSLIEMEGRTWYKTGDMIQNKEGYLFFVDRTGDIIKHKGYRVAASEVEAVLQDHPAVIGAAAVGVSDPKVGERIKAFVVLKSDARGVTSYDLMRWCRERIASYKVPAYIEFRDMLPKSKVGKLLRRELRDEERRRMEKQ